jgi:hypothetical protein
MTVTIRVGERFGNFLPESDSNVFGTTLARTPHGLLDFYQFYAFVLGIPPPTTCTSK